MTWSRIAVGSLGAATIIAGSALVAGWTADYGDDSFAVPQKGRVVKVHGDQGFERLKYRPGKVSPYTVLDLRDASFHVANSRNARPTAAFDCEHGMLPVNRYPLVIDELAGVAVVGGLFLGDVPQATEWQATYCNSAAITFVHSPRGRVDGVRVAGAWDGIRMGQGAPGLVVTNSWISEARDDALEDDFLQSATVSDSLIDGAYQGISVKPRRDSAAADASHELVTLSGVLLRLSEYDYKGAPRFGALLKSDRRAPRLRIRNSVIAIDYHGGTSYPQFWRTSWSKLDGSSDNLLLWLSDAPVPDFLSPPRESFRLVTGDAARRAWLHAKTNWINCHPRLRRLASDLRSNPQACVAGTWGGFTN